MDFFGILFDMKNGKKIPYSKNYFDTLFAENLAGVTTLTGTLPLTFTTSETELRSWTLYGANKKNEFRRDMILPLSFSTLEGEYADTWTIYGNAEGVGERTKNLLEITAETQTLRGVTFTTDKQAGTVTMDGDTTQLTAGFSFEVMSSYDLDGTFIFSGCADGGSASKYDLYMYDAYDQRFSDRLYNSSAECSFTCVSGHKTMVFVQVRKNNIYSNIVFKPMLRAADTSPDFIPYGYQVPITVSQTGQTDKNLIVFVGSAPLTEGQSISDTEIIEIFEGENTVSTTLTNKPVMSIRGLNYYGIAKGSPGNWYVDVYVYQGQEYKYNPIPVSNSMAEGNVAIDTAPINTFVGENTIQSYISPYPTMTIKFKE